MSQGNCLKVLNCKILIHKLNKIDFVCLHSVLITNRCEFFYEEITAALEQNLKRLDDEP